MFLFNFNRKNMKKHIVYLMAVIPLIVGTSCNREATKESLVYLDVTRIYPEKEVLLSDIADVSYLQMQSDNGEYLFKGTTPAAFGKNTVVILDQASTRLLFFSKEGEPKSYISRKGSGPEEYVGINQVVYDEEKDEVFVVYRNIIQVYSSTGEHKRRISLPSGTFVNPVVSFDDHSLFLYDASIQVRKAKMNRTDEEKYFASSFVRIDKTDGKLLEYVELPATETVLGIYREVEGRRMLVSGYTNHLIKSARGLLLCNPETDTVFLYDKDKNLKPMVTKIPPIGSQDPMIYLNNCVDAGRYLFTEVYTLRFEEGARPYPVTYLMYDKKIGEWFRQKIVLSDYKGKTVFISPKQTGREYENGAIFELDLIELKQAYEENKLSGKLKEIVAASDENEDNNIFVLFQFKQ
jgi:hypothetical protein